MRRNKIFFICLILVGMFNYIQASSTNQFHFNNLNNAKQIDDIKPKSIKSRADYKELENILKTAIANGDNRKLIILGLLYNTEHKLDDGSVIKAKKDLATKYFKKALEEGYGLASLMIIANEKLSYTTIDDILFTIEKGLKASKNKLSDEVVLSVTYNSIVLDNVSDKMNYVHRALDLTYPISQKVNKSTLDFTVAVLLQIAGKPKKAKVYLNSACNNPEADTKIKSICDNAMFIKNTFENNNKERPQCGRLN